MLLSKYFLPILKEVPSNATIASHKLMLKSGMISQSSSGIYSWLPLGLRVLNKITAIVRSNMDRIDCLEMLMPCTQSATLWKESGRYDDYGKELLKFSDRHNNELLFGPTAEEHITDIIRDKLKSYKDLPRVLYQIQWKFRDEIRPRFGLIRAREFLMKDAYSFDLTHEDAIKCYREMFSAYMRTFREIGLKVIPLRGDSGEIGGSLNHEFHVVCDVGETGLYYSKEFDEVDLNLLEDIDYVDSFYSATDEVYEKENSTFDKDKLSFNRGIEVGQIFNFGDKYSSQMNAMINDVSGKLVPLQMGSYGIGISRLVAAIIEVNHDKHGIIWPDNVAPFKISLINLHVKNEVATKFAENIYQKLSDHGIDVLYDDSFASPGSKFATHDLIGNPWQIIISEKNTERQIFELKERSTGIVHTLTECQIVEKLVKLYADK